LKAPFRIAALVAMTTLAAAVLAVVLYGRWHAVSSLAPDTGSPQSFSQSGRPPASVLESLPATTAGLVGTGEQNAVEFAPDGGLVVAGRADSDFGVNPIQLLGGGAGTILRLDPGGNHVRSLTRIGSDVDDLAIDRDGRIAAVGNFGLAALDPAASRVLWLRDLGPGGGSVDGPGRRVAAASDGTIAALFDKTISTFDTNGRMIGHWTLSQSFVNDIAVDGATRTVVVTGFTDDRLRGGQPVQVAFVTAYSYDGAARWRDFGFSGSDLKSSQADSRGYRVTLGRDSKLYLLAESDSGNSIFQYQPRSLSSPAPLVQSDAYNTLTGAASNHVLFFARLDPQDGRELVGEFAFTRSPGGAANALRGRAIDADEQGDVFVGGFAACCIPSRTRLAVAGQQVPGYSGDDLFVLGVSSDFKSRLFWAAWGGRGSVHAVAGAKGSVAMAGRVTSSGLVSFQPLVSGGGTQPTQSSPDGYLSVWKLPNRQ
jgi:hypothetical protein